MPFENLRKNLPNDYIKRIYERMNKKYSWSMIQKTLYGERNNDEIIEAAIQLAEETKAEKIQKKLDLENRINAIEEEQS